MIDSYLAPVTLAEARRRIQAAALQRTRRLVGPNVKPTDPGIVHLAGKRIDRSPRIDRTTAAVVSDMVLWRWDAESLRTLAERLPPGSALVFCEPTADFGWRRGLHRMTRNLWRVALRHNFEADVPARLRAAGLVVTTVDRFAIGPLGLRSYVWGQAEHLVPKDLVPKDLVPKDLVPKDLVPKNQTPEDPASGGRGISSR